MVTLLYLCVHPDIPKLLIERNVATIAVKLLYSTDHIIRELSVILLKALILYDSDAVTELIPADKAYLLQRDLYNPQLYGGEYGGMIQDYLQDIVEHRRDQSYLREMLTAQDIIDLELSEEDLDNYEDTFMELDADCGGTLDVDELKILVVLMGEKMDKEEVNDLLDQYDTDKYGSLDFREFVIMMKGWNTRFGTGLRKKINLLIKRGPIAKFRREFNAWWNRDKIEAAQVALAREKRLLEKENSKEVQMKYFVHDQLKEKRRKERKKKELGIWVPQKYTNLPSIS